MSRDQRMISETMRRRIIAAYLLLTAASAPSHFSDYYKKISQMALLRRSPRLLEKRMQEQNNTEHENTKLENPQENSRENKNDGRYEAINNSSNKIARAIGKTYK